MSENKKIVTANKIKIITVVLSCYCWGILAHGYAMFNKLSWHDDQGELFGVGATYASGRWMLGLLGEMVRHIFGESNYSLPTFSGLMTISFICIAAYLIIDMYRITNMITIVGICGVMVSIPVITGLFGYMFTAPYYMLGMLLSVSGGFLLHNYAEGNKRYGGVYVFLGILFITCGTGIYQADYPVASTTLLLSLFLYTLNKSSKKELFFRAVLYAGALVTSLVIYLVAANIFAHIHNVDLTSYAGIDSMGKTAAAVYLSRVKIAFVNFGQINCGNHSYNMYPMTTNIMFRIMLAMLLIMSIFLCTHFIKQKKYIYAVISVILLGLFPLSLNLIFVLSDIAAIHTLMMYTWVFVPVLLAVQTQFITQFYEWISRYATIASGAVIIILALMYSRYSNVCYLEATLIQSQTISYFDQMITRIRSTDGYTNETPIVFINARELHDSRRMEYSAFEAVSTIPYANSIDAYLNTHTWARFMANWNGYNPIRGNPDDYDDNIKVMQMPAYPDDGSIIMLDGVIIVKFGE